MALSIITAGQAQSVARYTLSDNLATRSGYSYNQLYFEAAPAPDFSLNVSVGRTRITGPAPDITRSLGFGGWILATRKLDVAVGYDTYNGEKSQVLRLKDLAYVGVKPDRQTVHTLYGTLGLDLIGGEGGGGDEADEDGEAGSKMRLELGASSARNIIPVWVERFAPLKGRLVDQRLKDYEIVDTAYSSKLAVTLADTTLSGSYRRHHYTQPPPPPEASRPEIAAIVRAITWLTVNGLPPFPRYESTVKLEHKLTARFGLSAAYDYILTNQTGGIVRYLTGEASWEVLSWLEIRGGSYWERMEGGTTRFTTMGVSLYF